MTTFLIPPDIREAKKTYEFVYDFTVQGGAISTITMRAVRGAIPANFIVQNAFLDVITGFTGTAVIAVDLQTAGDLVVAAVAICAPYSTAGRKVTIILLGTIATWIKTTAVRTPTLTVTVGAITAGKMRLFVEGFQSEA